MARATPLLKFPHNAPTLVQEGMEVIRSLRGAIVPIVFIGDGRGGKSLLASKVSGTDDVFASRNIAEPVTEGIDVVAVAHGQGHFLFFDAEGGNNALAAFRTMVNVLSANVATHIVFVAGGNFSEESLQTLGATLAVRDLIQHDVDSPLPPQSLMFLVNKATLNYQDQHLEQALAAQHDVPRTELRQRIVAAFPAGRRNFLSVPMMQLDADGFELKVQQLSAEVRNAVPLEMAGVMLDGTQVANLIHDTFNAFQVSGQVHMPSVTRSIIFDGFLMPLVERHGTLYQESLPVLAEYNADLANMNPMERILGMFDQACAHIAHANLKAEARLIVLRSMDQHWDALVQRNTLLRQAEEARRQQEQAEQARLRAEQARQQAEQERARARQQQEQAEQARLRAEQARQQAEQERERALAMSIVEAIVETQEIEERSYHEEVGRSGRKYGIAGPRKAIKVTRTVYRIENRTRNRRANGEVFYTPWAASGHRTS